MRRVSLLLRVKRHTEGLVYDSDDLLSDDEMEYVQTLDQRLSQELHALTFGTEHPAEPD